jgi:hypothetical protein
LEGGVGIVTGAAVLPELGGLGLAKLARIALIAHALQGAADVPGSVVAGEAPNLEMVGQMYEEIIESFEPAPPPPKIPVPTVTVGPMTVVPVSNKKTCP